ncbi:hypothetical protein [Clostridium estertheticum]|uniref:hypothetical protein n=1 Tax=Clostridium estertheticum TaxID=238834 RepID=UPI001C0DB070|nr:hypothetical protein [Clostridium estertheticum]MBU3186606.1 hypothetical protein [Clostridium estertheticum]
MGTFNKVLFAELLSLARGDQSINNYSKECGVSSAHISRLSRGLVDTPPLPDTLKSFSIHARNNITYKKLMDCAGYNENNGIGSSLSDSNLYQIDNKEILQLIKVCDHLELYQIQLLIHIAKTLSSHRK